MQTIILNDQESDQIQSPINVRNPLGTLIVGLFLGLVLMFFDRQPHLPPLDAAPERPSSWGRTFLILFMIGFVLFILVNLIMGP